MNLVNDKDLKVEVKKLAARLTDNRARSWFMRVVLHFVTNIDLLLKKPYTAKAVPRSTSYPPDVGGGNYGPSKYYADPKGGWLNPAPEMPPEAKLSRYWGEEPMGGHPESCNQCGGSGQLKTIDHAETGEPYDTPSGAHDTPEEKQTYEECPACHGTGQRSPEKLKSAYLKLPPEQRQAYLEKLPPELQGGVAEALVFHLLDAADANPVNQAPDYDRVKRTYTTALHEPVIQKDIEQSFAPYNFKKAKAKAILGEPPSKKQFDPVPEEEPVPDEADDDARARSDKRKARAALSAKLNAPPEEGKPAKEFFHFDPIQVRRRELFIRLNELVFFLTYQTQLAAHRMDFEPVPEEQRVPGEADDDARARSDRREARAAKKAEAMAAEALLQQLATIKTDDIEHFRSVLQQSYEWNSNVKERPWEYTNDGKAINSYVNADHATITLHRVMYQETALVMSQDTQWETANERTVNKVMTDNNDFGGIYIVKKGKAPYVLVTFAPSQFREGSAKDIKGSGIAEEIAHEIAPLFMQFPPEQIVNVPVIAREVNLPEHARHVMDFEGGWRLVQLIDPFDLLREGCVMAHCIKNESHREHLITGTATFYSLRNPVNKAIATIEIRPPNQVVQTKGYQNSTRFPENVKAMIRTAAAQQGWILRGSQDEQALQAVPPP